MTLHGLVMVPVQSISAAAGRCYSLCITASLSGNFWSSYLFIVIFYSMFGTAVEQEQQSKVVRDLESAIYQRKKAVRNRRANMARASIAMSKDWNFVLTPASASLAKDKDHADKSAAEKRKSFQRRSSTGSMLVGHGSQSDSSSTPAENESSRPTTPHRKPLRSMRRSITSAIAPLAHLVTKAGHPEGDASMSRSPSRQSSPPSSATPGGGRGKPMLADPPSVLVSDYSQDTSPSDADQVDSTLKQRERILSGESSHSAVKFDLPPNSQSRRARQSYLQVASSEFETADDVLAEDEDGSSELNQSTGRQERAPSASTLVEEGDTSSIGNTQAWSFIDLDLAVTVNIRSGQCCLYPEPIPKETRYGVYM